MWQTVSSNPENSTNFNGRLMKILLVLSSLTFLVLQFVLFPDIADSAKIAKNYLHSSTPIPQSVEGHVLVDAILLAQGATYAKILSIVGTIQSLIVIAACFVLRSRRKSISQPATNPV
jgi:hypothetical protein